ncbi:cytosolic regulator of adenylyl cyclase, partial [Planoprotostelium fungivorum]
MESSSVSDLRRKKPSALNRQQWMSKPESSVSSIVQQLSKGDEDVPPKIRLNLLNELVQISDQIESYDTDALLCCLRATLLGSLRTLRVAALRVIRYYLKNSEFTVHLISLGVNLFISRSLDKIDKQTEVERLQVLKLVRKWVVTCCETIPNNIVHSLVSLGEAAEDPLQRISVEVVCEITMRNPKVSANCGGIKLLLNAILDPNNVGIQESLVQGLAYLLNGSNRKFVRIPLDLGILLAPITECQIKETPPAPPPAPAAGAANNAPNNLAGNAQNKPQLTITNPTGQTSTAPKKEKKEDKVSMSIRAISILLRGWTGVFVLSSFPFGLASLVNAFYLPSHDLHVQVLDALFDIFRISDVDKNSDPSGTKLGSSAEEDHSFRSIGLLELPKKARGKQQNLLNNYLSVLLVAFIHCGLIEGLVTLGTKYSKNSEAGGQSTVTKATLLLGELLYLTNVLLPPNQCAKVQTLPKLVEFAASFTVLDPRQRSRASTMLSNLHSYHHQKHSNNNTAETSGATNDWKRLKLGDRRHERKIDSLKKLDAQLDQDQLRTKILESQVTTTKDHTKWKWDNISDLIDGPLLSNPTLLTQVMKTKFIKRVLSYFRPLTQAFAALPWTPENDKYRRIAVQLLQVLVSTEQGADYLKHSKLIPEIIDIIKLELDPVANAHPAHKERPLSSEKMWKKMSAEYFTILGSLSTTPRGMEILIDFGILDYLTALVALPSRDDLFATIVTSLDYTTSDHTRMFLSKALSSSSKGTRFRATRHLHVLVRSGVQNFDQWGITFLLDQLNDGDIKASKMALNALTEACNQVECMDALIAAKPQLLKHGPAGKHLWL